MQTYISGNCFAILAEPETLLQTVYDDADERPLEAIAFDEASGKIAVCTTERVRIYRPLGVQDEALKWVLQSCFPLQQGDHGTVSLSWGSEEELLVGSSLLELYRTSSTPSCVWRRLVANPVKVASFSYDSAYIASVSHCDSLVKVWRRLSYGGDGVRFDFMYLRHPQPVTSLQWRKPYSVDQTIDNVLYTFCNDNLLRIWTGSDSHGQQHVHLWGTVDLAASIQDASIDSSGKMMRWGWVMHGRDFSAAVERAVLDADAPASKDDAPLQHLIDVANKAYEVCVVFDGRGRMSAWGLENVGPKSHTHTSRKVFNITHVRSPDFDFLKGQETEFPHVEIYSYCDKPAGNLHMLIQYFDGKIEVYQSNIARFFDIRPNVKHLTLSRVWAGHSAPVKKIVRNFSGRAIVSRTVEEGECIVWRHALNSNEPALSRQAVIFQTEHIHRTCVLRKGRFVLFLGHENLSLWDCRQSTPVLISECGYAVEGKPLCLLVLPRPRVQDFTTAHVATITSDKRGIVWELKLPAYAQKSGMAAEPAVNGHQGASMHEFCRFDLGDAGDLAYVLPVDPAGSPAMISGSLDVFARDVAISYTRSGRVEFWTARLDEEQRRVDWLSTSSMETGVSNPALVSGSTMKKAALVNSSRTAVTIWDIRGARLEYTQDYDTHNTVQDLDWTSTPDSQSILAVGFPSRVVLLSQMRFDYLNKGPAWAPIREINIRELTPHPIGDSTWLGDGHLVVGAGNQLFAYDRHFDVSSSLVTSLRLPHRKGGMWDLFEVVQRLNGPLPVFHPQFLSQCMLCGKISLVHSILMALHETLKFWVEGEPIGNYLDIDLEQFFQSRAADGGGSSQSDRGSFLTRRMSHDNGKGNFTEEVAKDINEKLTHIGIPQLSGHEQIQLVDIVECAGLVEQQRRSLDENGAKYMLFFRQHTLRKRRTDEMDMSWREINWAYHSSSQDILVDFVSRQHHGTLLWENAKESGMFMWLTDPAAVVSLP